jgi:phosphoglycerate kinase
MSPTTPAFAPRCRRSSSWWCVFLPLVVLLPVPGSKFTVFHPSASQQKHARVVLCSHLGRPKGKTETLRMAPVAERLTELLGQPVIYIEDCIGEDVEQRVAALQPGQVALLENVRFYKEEEKNDPDFAQSLARLADVYVNDAFGTAHRAHASTEGMAKYVQHTCAGFLMIKELDHLALETAARPLAAIIGGAKVSSKLPVIQSLLNKCDKLILVGGLVFTFLKARGVPVGGSMVEDDLVDLARELMAEAETKGVRIVLPDDILCADKFDNEANTRLTTLAEGVPEGWMGLDVGPESLGRFEAELADCKTIIWNGPAGVFEMPKFAQGTLGIAEILARLTANEGAATIVGGGDSVAAIEQMHYADRVTHVSTGGGATLELLGGAVLPGVAAIQDAK